MKKQLIMIKKLLLNFSKPNVSLFFLIRKTCYKKKKLYFELKFKNLIELKSFTYKQLILDTKL